MVKNQRVQKEIEEIERLTSLTNAPFDSSKSKLFSELPLSQKTKQGLSSSNYLEMTDIQRVSLGYTLCGRDVLGAAKTGSGKTLAFLIPILESLYRMKWTFNDGLGALVISPTRELALQIFGVLRTIGKYHNFSAGLIIGGKDVRFEQERINRMNILVCTPGRLLQHMDQTADFACNNLQLLVLDEADRILDMGFKKTVNAIVENLPKQQRQTLLFSATQTKSVRDLARLSLKDPEYVSVHDKAQQSTPDNLQQTYVVCELFEKLDVLYSFVKSHLQSKCLIFLSSCKQVRFVYECFCKLQPGTVIMCLHGKQKQDKRSVMFEKFCQAKSAVLLCTDIAARGLDFPAVDWVVQADAPEDPETYIHRVGRTARFNANGKALLVLVPSEEKAMAELLDKKKVPLKKIRINPNKTKSIIPQLQSICAQSPDIKYLGEKAFICYLRSVWLQKNKDVFDIAKLPIEEYAASLGLPGAPRVKFVRKLKAEKNRSRAENRDAKKEVEAEEEATVAPAAVVEGKESVVAVVGSKSTSSKKMLALSSDSEDADGDGSAEVSGKQQHRTRLDKMFAKRNQSVLWEHYAKIKQQDGDEEDELAAAAGKTTTTGGNKDGDDDDEGDGFLTLARKDHELDGVPMHAPGFLDRPLSVRDKRYAKSKKIQSKEVGNPTRLIYDDEGTVSGGGGGGVDVLILRLKPHLSWKLETEAEFLNEEDSIMSRHHKYLEAAKEVMKVADHEDKKTAKDKLREKKRIKKLKSKGRKDDGDGDGDDDEKSGFVVTLGSPEGDQDEYDNDNEGGYESADDFMERHGDDDNDDNNHHHEPLDIDMNESSDQEPVPVKKRHHSSVIEAAPSKRKAAAKSSLPETKTKKLKKLKTSSSFTAAVEDEEELALRLLGGA